MKKTLLLAVLGVLGFAGVASAEEYVLQFDPSGAPMCFTEKGEKAPLKKCPPPLVHYVRVNDPSGAPMCFTEVGGKAPLASCGLVSSLDLIVSR
jgi:hypothetical protein